MDQTISGIADSLTVRTMLEMRLHRAGSDAFLFPDGLQARHALPARQMPHPETIILEGGVPKMDGCAVARSLKHQRARTLEWRVG